MTTERTDKDERPQTGNRARWQSRDLAWPIAIVAIIMIGRLLPFGPVRDFFGSFSWLTEQTLRLAKELFESYGYLTVLFAPMLENTLFLGALIPGTIIMLLAGLSAHDGLISFWPAVLLGIIGAIIGDTISYGMGRFGWKRLGPQSRLVRWANEMREPLLGHSVWLIFTYHFAGYSRLVGPAAAGFLRMPFLRWMMLDYIGVAVWAFAYIGGGYMLGVFGLTLDDSDRNVQVFEIILFVVFVIAIVSVMRAARGRRVPSHSEPPPGAPDRTETSIEEQARERVH